MSPFHHHTSLTILAAVALLLPQGATAGPPPDAPPPAHASVGNPVSITVSGGVSMGAYEAGLLHYALTWLRTNAARAELKQVTGASAGSVNSVLSMFAQCGEPQDSPMDSLFWKVWVPLGLDQLFLPEKASKQSAFSRAWFELTAEELERQWTRGFRSGCDVVLGFSATRVVPRNVRVGSEEGTLSVPRIEERFVLRVQGRGPGKLPRLTNYTERSGIGDPLLLPEDEHGEIAFKSMRDLLFASTAFPVAFAPVELAHCVAVRESGKPPSCPAANATRALFVDGGLFDNTPLALAVSNAAAGLRDRPGGGVEWLDRADAASAKLPRELTFLYLETDVAAYTVARRETQQSRADPTLVQLLGKVSGSFMTTARSKNLYTLIEQMPGATDRIRATARHYPAASAPMMAFLGFFEKEFRRYDFYLGMYDARKLLNDRFIPRAGVKPEAFTFPEARFAGATEWRPLGCLRSLFDGVGDPAAACGGTDLNDIRILAQVSLDRLYEECRHPKEEGSPPITHPQCRAANEGGTPPQVPDVTPLAAGAWQKAATESEIQWVVRLLAAHGFQFRDLGATRPEQALARIREKMGDVVEATADQQPGWERAIVRRSGLMAANALLYVPYKNRLWVGLGRELELGYGRTFTTAPGFWSRFRLDAGMQIQGIYTLLSSDDLLWGFQPFAGTSFRLPGFDTQSFQLNALARGSYLWSKGDDFNSKRCATDGKPIGSCSGWSVQAGVSAEALEVLFFRLMVEWYSPGSRWALAPMMGVQLGF